MRRDLLDTFSEEEKLILQKRAKKLAQKNIASISKDKEYLVCKISDELYGFETRYMKEVFQISSITPLPSTPEWLLGIINARGEIISVVDLRYFFDLKIENTDTLNRVLILHSENMTFGILIDGIHAVMNIADDDLTTEFITFDKVRKDYLLGLTKENIILLDAEKILNDPKMIISGE